MDLRSCYSSTGCNAQFHKLRPQCQITQAGVVQNPGQKSLKISNVDLSRAVLVDFVLLGTGILDIIAKEEVRRTTCACGYERGNVAGTGTAAHFRNQGLNAGILTSDDVGINGSSSPQANLYGKFVLVFRVLRNWK